MWPRWPGRWALAAVLTVVAMIMSRRNIVVSFDPSLVLGPARQLCSEAGFAGNGQAVASGVLGLVEGFVGLGEKAEGRVFSVHRASGQNRLKR